MKKGKIFFLVVLIFVSFDSNCQEIPIIDIAKYPSVKKSLYNSLGQDTLNYLKFKMESKLDQYKRYSIISGSVIVIGTTTSLIGLKMLKNEGITVSIGDGGISMQGTGADDFSGGGYLILGILGTASGLLAESICVLNIFALKRKLNNVNLLLNYDIGMNFQGMKVIYKF